ncbi:VTT domain-containing protein [Candidatus Kaiserbacteria bacterium]|nr:VTT domain-containing protein [Candidatus Kaiserbacteria bacterium]
MLILESIIAFISTSRYFLIFIGCYIEGAFVMMATGVLWQLGIVSFWPAYVALLLGDFLADIMWYCIGRFGARHFLERWGYVIGASPPVVERISKHFHDNQNSILIVSKLTTGFGFALAVLTTAGIVRVPFKRFAVINFLGSFVWVFAMMFVGYHFGNLLSFIPKQFWIVPIIVTTTALIFALRYASKKIERSEW